ncbi:MAG: ATP-binding protein [Gemmatimonadota bacterium]
MTTPQTSTVPDAALAEIAAISSDAIICVDDSHLIIFFNAGAEAVFGWTAEEVLGEPLDRLLPAAARDAHGAHLEAFARSADRARPMGQRTPIAGVRKSGEEFPAEASIAKVEHDGRLVLAVALRDNSERARAEREQQFLARAGVVLASSLDVEETCRHTARLGVGDGAAWSAVYLLDPGSNVLCRAACEHARASHRAQLKGLPARIEAGQAAFGVGVGGTARLLDELPEALEVDPDAGLVPSAKRSVIVAPLPARDAAVGVLVLVAPDDVSFDGNAVFAAQELAGRAAVAIDNARLYESARRAVLGRDEIMSIVSHDIGTAISAILVSGKALERRLGDAPEADLVSNIRNAARQVGRLVSDLLDAERLERGGLSVRPEATRVADVVRRAREIVDPPADTRGVRIRVEVGTQTPSLMADADRVVQILCNVVGNAVKYSPDGGAVTVTVAGTGSPAPAAPQAAVPVEEEARFVHFRISDDGPGIASEDLSRLFEPFWRRPNDPVGGAGLGLAIARGLVRAHGGEIAVESALGDGTAVSFTIPAAPRDADD